MTSTDPGTAARYTLLGQLGSGGQGAVWEAHDRILKRRVAVKLLRTDDLTRTYDEARATARISHQHVVEIHDVSKRSDGQVALVMEYCAGGSLHDHLKSAAPMPVREAAALVAKVARGLAALHDAHLVHRDIKPRNILLTADGVPKIADFGLSRGHGDAAELAGTAGYLAPELRADAPATPEADVFALGVTLYIALERSMPFAGSAPEQMNAARRGRIRPPGNAGAAAPLLRRALAADPARRPSAARMAGELEAIAAAPRRRPATRPLAGSTPAAAPAPAVHRPPTRRRWPVALGAALAAVAVAVGIFVFGTGAPSTPVAPAGATPTALDPAPQPSLTDVVTMRWENYWDEVLYQPFTLVQFTFDASTIGDAFPFGLLLFVLRLLATVVVLIPDLLLTIVVWTGGVGYALFDDVGRNVVYVGLGIPALIALVALFLVVTD